MPIKVLLNTSPLGNANAIRGVGVYTRFLAKYLSKNKNIELALSEEKRTDFRPEIVHYPFFDLFYSTLPLVKRGKTIVTIHDVIPLLYPKKYPVGKKGTLALLRQKLALKTVDAVITDSESSKTDIAKYLKYPVDKIYPISLAANPELKKATPSEIKKAREKYDLPEKYLLYVGDINYNKNIPQLIKTLKFLPEDLSLVCVGKNFYPHNIPEWQAIEAQVALSNVTERVKFLTDVAGDNGKDLQTIYSAALVYVQPSLYEGFGLPILEAMQCEIPVVCAENSSLVEVALNKAVLVKEAEAEQFAEAVEKILSWKKVELKKFTDEALKHAKKFTWNKTAKETLEVYKEVLKK